MGLFDRIFTKKEPAVEHTNPLVQIVLLKNSTFSFEKLVEDFEEEWLISVKERNIIKDKDGGLLFTARISSMSVAVKLVSTPVPRSEITELAKNNFNWPEAVAVARQHTSHLIVSVNTNRKSMEKAASLLAELCSSSLKQNTAMAVDTFYAVLSSEFYSDMAHLYIDECEFPVLNYVFVGGYSTDGGKTRSGYTYGMERFNKKEIEILNSVHSGSEIFHLLTDTVSYVLENDVTLHDGETIGFSENQCLQIRESAGVIPDGNTLKLDFNA